MVAISMELSTAAALLLSPASNEPAVTVTAFSSLNFSFKVASTVIGVLFNSTVA